MTAPGGRPRPIVLVVLDGFGIGRSKDADAIAAAAMPRWRALLDRWPHSVLQASEGAVALPRGQMGNSEVGHLNLGTGRPVLQDLPRIGAAIVDGQLRGALEARDPETLAGAGLVVAYEPVWAIGTGKNARGADAEAMAQAIRASLRALGWGSRADETPLLYGGSVTSANIEEFLSEPGVDGALIGGASLKPDEMAGIAARAGITARARGLAS